MVTCMAEPHKRPYRHSKYKTAYLVKNWRKYEPSLCDRGDITRWITPEAISAWREPMTSKRSVQSIDADLAIETALAFRLLFRLPFRQMEDFLSPVLKLMGLLLPCPDHTTLSRRNATVTFRRQVGRMPERPVSVIIDSTGLKVCGQGEWRAQKHGDKKYRSWKKLRLGVDDQGRIMTSSVTDGHEQDPSQAPEMLSQIDQDINRFVADGIYDQQPVYAAVEAHSPGAQAIIPPRKDAALSRTATTSPTQRDQHISAMEKDGLFAGKRTSGYDAQSHAENAFARVKRTFGGRLLLKRLS